MRISFIKILIFLLSCGICLSGSGQLSGDLPLKKIQRSLEKEWGDLEFGFQLLYADPGGHFYRILSNDIPAGYLYAGRVNTCRPGGCAVPGLPSAETEGFENFRYYMILDDPLSVREVRIFEYNATHGQEVTARSWLRQFLGIDPEDEPGYGDEIEAISGATISGLSITADINRVLDRFRVLQDTLSQKKTR